MKNLVILLTLITITLSVNGQNNSSNPKNFIWSIGIKPSLPIGHFHDYSGFGLGGSLQGEYKQKMVGITLNAGYIDYFGKSENGVTYNNFGYIPLMAGLKYYLGSMAYLHGQVGPGFGTDGLGTSFWYGGGIGFNFTKAVDVELGYMGWKQNEVSSSGYGGTTSGGGGSTGGGYGGHYSTIDLRLAYNF